MRTISLKLPEELDQRLTDLAEQRGLSRSAIIREALESFTARSGESVTSRAGELVGSLEGPSDLSANPRHLQGYGR
jgi:predicted transcriptional regulator